MDQFKPNRTLDDLEGNALREATLLFLRQNHYVTERCDSVVTPAMSLHTASKKEIKHFAKEESGHDKLLNLSFQRLGVQAEDIKPLDSIIKLMDFFEHTARTNLLGWCYLVDMFERSPESHENTMVKALLRMGEDSAAEPIQKHSLINHEGGHDHESFDILSTVGLVSEKYLMEGCFLAFQASELMINFMLERNECLVKIHKKYL